MPDKENGCVSNNTHKKEKKTIVIIKAHNFVNLIVMWVMWRIKL